MSNRRPGSIPLTSRRLLLAWTLAGTGFAQAHAANYHAIVVAHEEELASQEAGKSRNLTALPADNPFAYEVEQDARFNRWADFVEPRVGPSGDLDILRLGQREALRFAALEGHRTSARGAWEALGPYAPKTTGAGRLNFVEFHPTQANTYMAGSPGGGLWFTQDGGQTWTTPTDRIANLGATWAAYDPANPDIIYLGTGDGFGAGLIPIHGSIGLLKTTDGGKTWNPTGLAYDVTPARQIVKVMVHPRTPRKVYVGTSQGLQVSLDGAATFAPAPGITGKVWDIEFHPRSPDTVYVATTDLYRSIDGGTSFSKLASLPSAGARIVLAVTPAAPDNVYALRAGATMQGFHRSTDAGQTFSQVDNGFYCEQSFYSFSLAVSPKNPDEIFAGCENLYRHNPAGSWESVSMYAPGSSRPQIMVYHPDVHDIRYLADGTFLAVTDGGLHHNLGGTNWVQLNNNLNVGQSYRVGVKPGDYDHVCTGRQDNGADIKAGASAAFQTSFDKDGMGCFWNSDGTRWYSTAQMGDFKYCDYANGQTGTCTYGNGANNHPKEKGSWDTPWSAHPTDPSVLFAGMNNMWRSPDRGATWTQMGTLGGTGGIRNFTVAPSNSQVIYVVKNTKIFRTTDGGSAWQDVTGTLAGIPTDVSVSAANPDHAWVTMSGYDATRKVYRSVNGGQAWTNETASGLPNLPANTVVADDLGSNGVYVGMDIGVFYKRDGMASWQDFSGGLPNVQVRELEMGRKGAGTADRMLFAATFGRGVLRTRLWDDLPAHSRRAGAPPALRDFSASFSGSTLHLGFRLDGGEGTGATVLRLARLDGKILHGEETLHAGYHERRIDLAGQGKGLCLLILENAIARIAKPIVIP